MDDIIHSTWASFIMKFLPLWNGSLKNKPICEWSTFDIVWLKSLLRTLIGNIRKRPFNAELPVMTFILFFYRIHLQQTFNLNLMVYRQDECIHVTTQIQAPRIFPTPNKSIIGCSLLFIFANHRCSYTWNMRGKNITH